MMRVSVLFAAALAAGLAGTAQAAAEAYTIEPFHTYPSFVARQVRQDQREDLA